MPPSLTPTLRDDFSAALLAGDAVRARHLVDQVVEEGADVRDVYLEVLAPALEQVGDLWQEGEIGVAVEHYATAVVAGIVGALAPRIRVTPTSGRLAIVTCAPGELHALGAQMVGDFLEAEGWEVLSLGASIPSHDLAELADGERPDVVAISAATVQVLPGLAETLARLQQLEDPPYVAVGGRVCREMTDEKLVALGADVCVRDPRGLVALLTDRFPPLPPEEEEAA